MQCGARQLDLSVPQVMGILNTTPDSFSDGGRLAATGETVAGGGFRVSVDQALHQAESMLRDGAAILDIGGESTRPGARPISVQEEMERVLPVVEAIAARLDVCVSVDTSKPDIIREAAALGAGLVNDVRALQWEGALEAVAESGMAACLMHMQGEPGHMQSDPRYDDVCRDVSHFLERRVEAAEAAGVLRNRLLIDPGFGFGKTLDHNYQLLAQLRELSRLGLPILVGMSRKSMIGQVVDRPVGGRAAGSVAAAVAAVLGGARIVRAHDVAETVDALRVCGAILERKSGPGA